MVWRKWRRFLKRAFINHDHWLKSDIKSFPTIWDLIFANANMLLSAHPIWYKRAYRPRWLVRMSVSPIYCQVFYLYWGLSIGFLWFSLHLLFFSDLWARSEALGCPSWREQIYCTISGHPQIANVVLMGSFQIRAWKQVQNVVTNINLIGINSQYWQSIASVWSGMIKN